MQILEATPTAIEFPLEDDVLVATYTHLEAPTSPVEATSTPETEIDVIRRYFGKDSVLMLRVAHCESTLKQTNEDGTVLKGKITPLDRGVFQISLKYHQKELDELGLDAHLLEDNVRFAKILFDRNGTSDWSASRSCWK